MKRKVKMAIQPPSFRPTVVGTHYAAATGHYLGTAAAMRILDGGGNAVDAGVCAAMALAILQPDMVSLYISRKKIASSAWPDSATGQKRRTLTASSPRGTANTCRKDCCAQ